MQTPNKHSEANDPSALLVKSIGALNQPTIAFDEQHRVCYANERAYALFGKPSYQLIGSHLSIFLPSVDPATLFSRKQPQVLPIQGLQKSHQVALLIPSNARGLVAICFDSNVNFGLIENDNRDWAPRYSFSDIIGASDELNEAKKKARRVAATDATVLITGESGTGKELFAHGIHNESKRRNRPFVRLNCSSIPTELLEAELFGYEPGAFTGASKTGRPGMFEIANTGTIFLDEISQMNWDIQAKFLRILQEKEILRVGGTRPIMVDFRLIIATNASLEKMVEAGRFRSDLYYRINVYPITIPPLRQRREDIPVLIRYFTERLQRDPEQKLRRLSTEIVKALQSFDWPGNVRELLNVLEQLFISSVSRVIGVEDLPLYIVQRKFEGNSSEEISFDGNLKQIMEKTEKQIIVTILKKARGNKKEAAKLLGIHRSGLYQKLQKHGL